MTRTPDLIRIAYDACRMATAMKWLVVLGVIAVGCGTKKNPALSCADGPCTDPKFPFCDANGAVDGDPDTCIAVACTPGEFAACDGSNAISCNADGKSYESTSCDFGCNAANNGCNECAPNTASCAGGSLDTCDAGGVVHSEACSSGCADSPSPHCSYIAPRYLPDICDTPGVGTLEITQSGTLDTDLDATCTGGVVPQPGGPAICVARYASITIDSGATLHVISSLNRDLNANMLGQGRSIALVSDGDLDVDGFLDVSAENVFSGPGGGYTRSGGTVAGGLGQGGAGFATAGGAGGTTTTDGGGGNGGGMLQDPAALATFVGGPSSFGGGGGAALLISCRGTVSVTGTVNAGGGGGYGGWRLLQTPGGGGGAGGYVVLQGLDVHVTGEVYANGGGGGAGGVGTGGSTSEDGDDGSLSENNTARGGTPRTGAGAGGTGGLAGAATRAPGGGLHSTMSGANPGGGGGSVGFFQSYTPSAVTPTITPAHASPRFRPNANISLR